MTSVNPGASTWSFYDNTLSASDKVDAAALDTQINDIWSRFDELLTALAVTIRDDDQLEDEIVRTRCLHPEVISLIATGGASTDVVQGTGTAGAVPVFTGDHLVADSSIRSLLGTVYLDGPTEISGSLTLSVGMSSLGQVALPAGELSFAPLLMPPGNPPIAPADGEVWMTSAGLYYRISGVTAGPVGLNSVLSSEKGAANGVATLGADSKIPSTQLPAIAITDTFVVNSEANMLALTAEVGDIAIRSDQNNSAYILQTAPATVLGNWVQIGATLSGTGTSGTIPLWSGSATLGDSVITQSGSAVTVTGSLTTTSRLILPASTASVAPLRIPHGTATSSLTNGDIWTTTTGIYAYINSSIVGPLGTMNGSGTSGQIALFNGTKNIVNSILSDDGTTVTVPGSSSTSSFRVGGVHTQSVSINNVLLSNNLYIDNTSTVKHFATGRGTLLRLDNASGNLTLQKAVSATGGATATLVDCFTVLPTGEMGIKVTPTASNGVLQLPGTGSTVGANGILWPACGSIYFSSGGNMAFSGAVNPSSFTFSDPNNAFIRIETNPTGAYRRLSANGSLIIEGGSGSITINSGSDITFSRIGVMPATSTSTASIRLPHGTAPTSPVNGDFWTTTAGMYAQINGVTIGPFTAGSGGTSSSGTTGTIPKFTAASALGDSSISVDASGAVLIVPSAYSNAQVNSNGKVVIDSGKVATRARASNDVCSVMLYAEDLGSSLSIDKNGSAKNGYVTGATASTTILTSGCDLVVGTYDSNQLTLTTSHISRFAISGGGVITMNQGNCPTQYVKGSIWQQTATVTVGNTVTETTLLSGTGDLTLPANCLTAGRTVRIRGQGVVSTTGSSPTLTLRAKIGSTTVTMCSAALPAAQPPGIMFEVIVTCRAAGASVAFGVSTRVCLEGNDWTTAPLVTRTSTAYLTEDTTVSKTLDITAQWGTANALNSISIHTCSVTLEH